MKRKLMTTMLLLCLALSLHASTFICITLDDGTSIETLDVCSLGKSIAFQLASSVPVQFFSIHINWPYTSLSTNAPCAECQIFASGLDRPPAA